MERFQVREERRIQICLLYKNFWNDEQVTIHRGDGQESGEEVGWDGQALPG